MEIFHYLVSGRGKTPVYRDKKFPERLVARLAHQVTQGAGGRRNYSARCVSGSSATGRIFADRERKQTAACPKEDGGIR